MVQIRILRGVRVATPGGIQPASVHIAEGRILAVAGYDDVPRLATPEELGKSVLMAGLVQRWPRNVSRSDSHDAAASGITTLVTPAPAEGQWVDQVRMAENGLENGLEDGLLEDILPDSIDLRWRLAKYWSTVRVLDARIETLAESLCARSAVAARLGDRKGHIIVGYDADFVIWNPELTVVGQVPLLYGPVRETILRGQTIFEKGEQIGGACGQKIEPLRGSA